VLEVAEGSPARAAGIAPGDLLLRANGNPVETLDDLQRVMVLGEPARLALEVLGAAGRRTLEIRPRSRAAA
jgi:S1-C subfamily serine protease